MPAYGGVGGELAEIDMNGFDETVGVLLKGVVLGYKYAVPHMKAQKSGSIISTASVAGLQAGYGPRLFGLQGRRASLRAARRWSSRRISCAPTRSAPAASPPRSSARASARHKVADQFAEVMKQHLAKIQPTPRSGLPEDIANAALFLASDESTFVNGQTIAVDGALTAGPMNTLGKRIDFEKVISDFLSSLPEDQKKPA